MTAAVDIPERSVSPASRRSYGRRRRPYQRVIRVSAFAAVWGLRAAAFLLLFAPIALVVFLSFGKDAYTVFPPTGYSLRWYWNIFQKPQFVIGFLTSFQIAAVVTPASLVIGTLAAYALWRHAIPGKKLVETLLYSPIFVPLVVIGLGLLIMLNRLGFHWSFWNIVVGHIILTYPYAARAVLAVLARHDRQLDDAASGLGARPWRVFWHVVLPSIRPGLFAGGLFAFVMSFDDFAVTIFLIDPNTVPLPVAIYHYMEWNLDPTVSAVSAVLILIAVVGTLVIERSIGLDRFIGIKQ